MRELSNHAVRVTLGISRLNAAKLAGVAINTLAMFEHAPHAIREEGRAACEKLYKLFRHVLQHAPGKVG